MKKSSVIKAAVIITAAFLFMARFGVAQSTSMNWGERVSMNLRSAWNASRHPGTSTMLSSVKIDAGTTMVFVVFEGVPAPEPGLRIVAQKGNIATCVIDLDALPALASSPNVRYIGAGQKYYPTDDPGVTSVRAPRTHTRLGTTGEGVLLGIIDTGIDWTHPDFIDSEGKTRIEAILDLSDSPDSLGPDDLGEPGLYGGIVVYRDDIDKALNGQGNIRQRDYVGHGTHVAGIAAASPSDDTLNALGGVAPGASIVAIKVLAAPRDSNFLHPALIANGMLFLDSLSFFREMPYVANYSFGGSLGSHNGTGMLEQFLELYAHDYLEWMPYAPGRAHVVSSGNSRNDATHATGGFSVAGEDSTVLEISITGGQVVNDEVAVQIWLSPNHPGLDIKIVSPDGVDRLWLEDGDTLSQNSDAGVVLGQNAYGGEDPNAGDRLIYLILADSQPDSLDNINQLATGVWRIVIFSREGTQYLPTDVWDAYLWSSHALGARFASHVVETGTVGEPGTANSAITVGAYTVRTGWWSLAGGGGSLGTSFGSSTPGELTYFTSLGPTRDGRMKPEITAPGQFVMSSMSSDAWPSTGPLTMYSSLLRIATDSIHAVAQGTSMSAPHVAGVAALLLETDPSLTNAEIKELITSTASVDSQTAGAPDSYWGYGRANAAGAVAKAQNFQSGRVQLSATLNPADTLKTDSLSFTLSADFSSSLQSLANCRLRVSWPPEQLMLRNDPDSISEGLRLAVELDSSAAGVLNFQATSIGYSPDQYDLVKLDFKPLSAFDADSVFVGYEVLSFTGDIGGEDLVQSLGELQAGPLSIRLESFCPLAGDLNGDGVLSIFDVLEMLKVLSGQLEETLCSDMDGSGTTDIFDLLVQLGELKK